MIHYQDVLNEVLNKPRNMNYMDATVHIKGKRFGWHSSYLNEKGRGNCPRTSVSEHLILVQTLNVSRGAGFSVEFTLEMCCCSSRDSIELTKIF